MIHKTVKSAESVQGFVHVMRDYCGLTVLSICPDIEKHNVFSYKLMIYQAIMPTMRPSDRRMRKLVLLRAAIAPLEPAENPAPTPFRSVVFGLLNCLAMRHDAATISFNAELLNVFFHHDYTSSSESAYSAILESAIFQ